jgi:response regulator RpfG family c-di-GMP phosphodiesterase
MAIFKKEKLEKLQSKKSNEKKHTILIVDDEENNLNVLASVLGLCYNVIRATNGAKALTIINEMPKDQELSMVISDQRMPEMTGVELFEYLSHAMPDTIRIIVTGYTDVKSIIASINLGQIYQFVVKPFERVEFLMIVKQAIKTYELKQELNKMRDQLKSQLSACKQSHVTKDKRLEAAFAALETSGLQSESERIQKIQG